MRVGTDSPASSCSCICQEDPARFTGISLSRISVGNTPGGCVLSRFAEGDTHGRTPTSAQECYSILTDRLYQDVLLNTYFVSLDGSPSLCVIQKLTEQAYKSVGILGGQCRDRDLVGYVRAFTQSAGEPQNLGIYSSCHRHRIESTSPSRRQ